MKDKPVESNIISMLTTDFTKGLFVGDETRRNDDQVAQTEKRLALKSTTKLAPISSSFNEIPDLFKENGLFEGIPMTFDLYQKIAAQYPIDQPGLFNEYLKTEPITSADQLATFFSAKTQNRGIYLFALFRDYLSRKYKRLSPIPGDFWFDGVKQFGSVSKLMVNEGRFNQLFQGTKDSKIEPQVQDFPDAQWRPMTEAEQAIVLRAMNDPVGTNDPLISKLRLYIYGIFFDFYDWRGFRFNIPADPTQIPPGQIYLGGRYVPQEPQKPWPPGVINYVLFTEGPNGPHWDPQYAANWTGHRDPSDAIQPT